MSQARLRSHQIMAAVGLAALPGIGASLWWFGPGVLLQTLLAMTAAVATEALCLRLRGAAVAFDLGDYSALLTGLLIGVALPPLAPAWVAVTAAAGGVGLGKHLFGGLGRNPFNPAMVGYALVLITMPLPMTTWLQPQGQVPGLLDTLAAVFGQAPAHLDGLTGPTPLEAFRQRGSQTVAEFWRDGDFGAGVFDRGWAWVNLGYAIGGAALLGRGIIRWHAPVGMLLALGLCSAAFWDSGSTASAGSPLLHLFSGATMLGAFFIVTDPVSGATTPRGRLLFGAGVGVLVFMMRTQSAYPDGVAFAVLIMNAAVPWLDRAPATLVGAAR